MKYTRYDLKSKGKGSTMFLIVIILIFCFAYLIGTTVFKVFVKNKIDLSKVNLNKGVTRSSFNGKEEKANFIFIQGGIYENKENAIKTSSKLSTFGTSFTVEEEKKTRVLLGIFSEEKGKELSSKLSESGIDNVKITYTVAQRDLCDKEIIEIINADIQILQKLSEKDIKAIQTEKLKKWILSLDKVDSKSKNAKLLQELKTYNNNLPKEIDKKKALEINTYIYNFLNKVGK